MGQYSRIYKFINLVDYIQNVQVLGEQIPKSIIKYYKILKML
jgi:hypothetical protein